MSLAANLVSDIVARFVYFLPLGDALELPRVCTRWLAAEPKILQAIHRCHPRFKGCDRAEILRRCWNRFHVHYGRQPHVWRMPLPSSPFFAGKLLSATCQSASDSGWREGLLAKGVLLVFENKWQMVGFRQDRIVNTSGKFPAPVTCVQAGNFRTAVSNYVMLGLQDGRVVRLASNLHDKYHTYPPTVKTRFNFHAKPTALYRYTLGKIVYLIVGLANGEIHLCRATGVCKNNWQRFKKYPTPNGVGPVRCVSNITQSHRLIVAFDRGVGVFNDGVWNMLEDHDGEAVRNMTREEKSLISLWSKTRITLRDQESLQVVQRVDRALQTCGAMFEYGEKTVSSGTGKRKSPLFRSAAQRTEPMVFGGELKSRRHTLHFVTRDNVKANFDAGLTAPVLGCLRVTIKSRNAVWFVAVSGNEYVQMTYEGDPPPIGFNKSDCTIQ